MHGNVNIKKNVSEVCKDNYVAAAVHLIQLCNLLFYISETYGWCWLPCTVETCRYFNFAAMKICVLTDCI